jgi:hypothetical protein
MVKTSGFYVFLDLGVPRISTESGKPPRKLALLFFGERGYGVLDFGYSAHDISLLRQLDFVTPREECCRDQTAEADKTSEKLADV